MSSSPQWYVLRAISGQEKKVKEYLESEIERLSLAGNIMQILIPTEKVLEMRNGKKKTRERPYLPGYIFLQAILQSEVIQIVKDVPGVVGFLSAGKNDKDPLPMKESEVQKIIGKATELETQAETIDNPYSIGETVKVMDGPFQGFTGNVEEVHEEKRKLKVMVKIFGRNTPVELNYLQVERI